jgi:PncC family amidohydrolase
LIERGITLSTAESCTGGLLAQLLTDVPGISAVFREGWITYANQAKERSLGVPRELLEKFGAVSREVAEAMALGAARASGSRMAVAITGVAGPGGGTPEKPVGLVWLGLALEGRAESVEQRYLAVNDRASVRQFAANAALDLLRRRMPAR